MWVPQILNTLGYIHNGMKEIRVKGSSSNAIVSDEDYEYLNQWSWTLRVGNSGKGKHYAARSINLDGSTVNFYLHREVASRMESRELSSLEVVDHINGNPFDNRRVNLRVVSYADNAHNKVSSRPMGHTSKYHGVTKFQDKWKAQITFKGEDIYLGLFDSESEAAEVFDLAALKYYKNNACLNFPDQIDKYIGQLASGVNPKKSKTVTPTSKFEGVSWNGSTKSWVANITYQKERRYLGIFPTEEEAARARDLGAIKLIGRHATLNFPKLRQEYITQLENGFDPIPTKHVRTSKFKGVTFRKDIGGGRWQAYVTENGKRKYLPGTFETEHIAKSARDAYLKSR